MLGEYNVSEGRHGLLGVMNRLQDRIDPNLYWVEYRRDRFRIDIDAAGEVSWLSTGYTTSSMLHYFTLHSLREYVIPILDILYVSLARIAPKQRKSTMDHEHLGFSIDVLKTLTAFGIQTLKIMDEASNDEYDSIKVSCPAISWKECKDSRSLNKTILQTLFASTKERLQGTGERRTRGHNP